MTPIIGENISVTAFNFRKGMRVVRGKDWTWGNQDTRSGTYYGYPNGVGVIVSSPSDDLGGWIRVDWG